MVALSEITTFARHQNAEEIGRRKTVFLVSMLHLRKQLRLARIMVPHEIEMILLGHVEEHVHERFNPSLLNDRCRCEGEMVGAGVGAGTVAGDDADAWTVGWTYGEVSLRETERSCETASVFVGADVRKGGGVGAGAVGDGGGADGVGDSVGRGGASVGARAGALGCASAKHHS